MERVEISAERWSVGVSADEEKTRVYTVGTDSAVTYVHLDIPQTEALISALQTALAELKVAAQYGPCKVGDLKGGDWFEHRSEVFVAMEHSYKTVYVPAVALLSGVATSMFNDSPVTRLRKSEVRL